MKKFLIVIVVLALLVVLGTLAFRYFVTYQVTDVGGMENPEYSQSEN